LHYGNIGLASARKQGLKILESDFFIALGNIYYDKGNFGKALENYIEADKLYESLKIEQGVLQAAMNIGLIYDEQGLFDKALNQYNIALDKAKAAGNKKMYADCLHLLGALYYSKDNYKAINYWEQALEIYKFLNALLWQHRHYL
jgi:tetratricopeptide (TPR) repeat protein